ncbi:MAG: LON peptidase substrate-binding domain-containing protein [Bacteroidota bacterium]
MLPFFPLNIVAFPGEAVNLHVFEPRYKQLINDCLEESNSFGIPSYVTNKIEYGTEVEISEVSRTYSDGRLDIKTTGIRLFKVLEYFNPIEGKLYAGGEVTYIPQDLEDTNLSLLLEFKELSTQLFAWLGEEIELNVSQIESVFDIGHKIGLKPEEEYAMVQLTNENDRLSYAIKHLNHLLPALERAQSAQDRIKQNGHFKHLDPLNFR